MKPRLLILALVMIIISLLGCKAADTACADDEYSAGFERIGVLRSTDGGASWVSLGDACFHAPDLIPVDPSPMRSGSGIALYFLDLRSLNQETGKPRIIYRAESSDGLDFSQPESVFQFGELMTDPYVLALPGGGYRMYFMRAGNVNQVISASSADGRTFQLDEGFRTDQGAVPGALVLPDGRTRLFVAGDPMGIKSMISEDGLNFMMEEGVRIPADGEKLTDPHPIQLDDGSYLMVFALHPEGTFADEQARLASMEIHIASSSDAFNWTVKPQMVALGGVPGVVETEDGTLYIFYVDASHPKSP